MSGNVALPAFTVVIPNHNYHKWVAEAIFSAASDPYPNKRIVVIDDGSTDESWSVICRVVFHKEVVPQPTQIYAGKVFNVPVFAAHLDKAVGPSAARNIGMHVFWDETDIFGFLDSDDIYLPGKIEKSVKCMLQDMTKVGAVYTDYDTVNIDNGYRTRVYTEPFSRMRLMRECIVHSACIVNKAALAQCGLYDESMRTCEDWHLWLRISKQFVLVHVPESLMLVRVGSHNSTATVQDIVWQQNWQKIRDGIQRGEL